MKESIIFSLFYSNRISSTNRGLEFDQEVQRIQSLPSLQVQLHSSRTNLYRYSNIIALFRCKVCEYSSHFLHPSCNNPYHTPRNTNSVEIEQYSANLIARDLTSNPFYSTSKRCSLSMAHSISYLSERKED